MAATTHLKNLETKHAQLDEKIKSELKSPYPDTIQISAWKKKKLYLKEQIHARQV